MEPLGVWFPTQMGRRFFCGSVLGLLSITSTLSQQSASALAANVRAHLKDDRFQIVTSIRGLPLGVRDALQDLFGGSLDIAEPDAAFRATEAVDPKRPPRRLVTAACSNDRCIVYYERGGVTPTLFVTIFHWTPAATRFEWGGTAPAGLRTVNALTRAILSGSITGSNGPW